MSVSVNNLFNMILVATGDFGLLTHVPSPDHKNRGRHPDESPQSMGYNPA